MARPIVFRLSEGQAKICYLVHHAWSRACRAFLLLNGGCRQFGRSQPCVPSGSIEIRLQIRLLFDLRNEITAVPPTSPPCPSRGLRPHPTDQAMYRQITLSRYARLPPVDPLGGSSRGM